MSNGIMWIELYWETLKEEGIKLAKPAEETVAFNKKGDENEAI